jgi:hypothetical protein
MLKHAVQDNFELKGNKCLSDILMNSDIAEIVDTLLHNGKGVMTEEDVAQKAVPPALKDLVYGSVSA